VSLTLFSKHIRAGDLRHFAMHGFKSEFAFHLSTKVRLPTSIASDQRVRLALENPAW